MSFPMFSSIRGEGGGSVLLTLSIISSLLVYALLHGRDTGNAASTRVDAGNAVGLQKPCHGRIGKFHSPGFAFSYDGLKSDAVFLRLWLTSGPLSHIQLNRNL